jgi:hypothetical protein
MLAKQLCVLRGKEKWCFASNRLALFGWFQRA